MASKLVQPTKLGANLSRLNPQQQLFVEHLLSDPGFNLTEAARKAGYKTPAQQANKLLHNDAVQHAVGKALRLRLEKAGLDKEEVLLHLAMVLRLDPLDLFEQDSTGALMVKDLRNVPIEIRRCITKLRSKTRFDANGNPETVVEVELMSKDAALQLAMKHFGLSDERHRLEVGLDQSTSNLIAELLSRAEEANTVIIDAKALPAQ